MMYIFLGYVAVEIAAFWAMVHFFGFLWALFITIAVMGVGYLVLGNRIRSLGDNWRTAKTAPTVPDSPIGNAALYAMAGTLTIVPGAVSSIIGLLLMAKPVRKLAGPVADAVAMRRFVSMSQRAGILGPNIFQSGGSGSRGRRFSYGSGYIDGSVEDVVDAPASTVDDITVRNADGTVYIDLPEIDARHPHPRPDSPAA
ncbi:FxsA family protein [Gordonia sp. (in: high G+C Gram-positive bacteria)]|uniref:FxsA family protein n=1 Tax=Gordonia sp. (in: high G+C Gram-positive bacteria) TaxID=84139 RepID=UPI003C73C8E2